MVDTYSDPGDVGLVEAIWGADLGEPDDDRIAVVDQLGYHERRSSRGQLASAVAQVAQHLHSTGVVEDEIVGLILDNSVEFIAAFHGILAAGAVVLPLDPRSTVDDWMGGLVRHGVEVVVSGERQWNELVAAGHKPRHAIVVGASPENGASWDEVLAAPVRAGGLPVRRGGARTAVLAHSSGTQGKEKLVEISHHNLIANLVQIGGVHRLAEGDTVLAVTPFRHIYGMQMAMNHALLARVPVVIAPSPVTAPVVLDAVRRHEVTVAYLVPSVVAELAVADPGAVTSLRLIVSGGAPLAASAAIACSDRFGVPVVQGFGMTEAGCICFTPDGAPGSPTSVGVPVPGTEVRFVDPGTGTDVGQGEPGELWVRGPQVTAGYRDDVVATAGLIDSDGWLHSGDLAVQDEGGYVSIVGRLKNLIKYKGHQVAPAELEDLLLSHPAIADVAVFGVPDPVAGELPKAFVVRTSPVPLPEVVSYVADRVAPHKRVRLIEAVPAIPRSVTGKVSGRPLLEPGELLCGRRVIVTGGGRGLGRAFAERLAGARASVLITGRDEDTLRAAAADLRACGGQAEWAAFDIRDTAAAARALEAFGEADVLVNNAGVPGPLGSTWETDSDDWWHTIEVNLRGTELVTRTVLPGMIERGAGRVITVVSNAGRRRWPFASAYSVSKAAQIKLVENLAAELRDTGVVALAYDPGLLDIGITRAHFDRGRTGEPAADRILDWATKIKAADSFADVDVATSQLLRLASGAADDRSGGYVTHDEEFSTVE
ncbi:SDR family NAD(P)-dependent oxidoreductase [Amycolatopsis sp. NPDC049868]|uniref:SDR family NAD(P)-dependent oxidoreductase n=1 Tax=Amycolatopsis sp. NPDC049868 TaxID=3363934 RepID=UPI0037AE80BB